MPYLDHAATTPMLPEAVTAVAEALGQVGNPSSLHGSGRVARRRIEESRETIAAVVGARPSEVIFTAGGTEADNLAVKGIFWARRGADPRRRRVLVSAVEHHAVLDAADWLAEHEGAEVVTVPVDSHGTVIPEALRSAIEDDPGSVAVASIMWANNEVGTVMPVAELAAVAHGYDVPLHTDAVQAVGFLPVDFAGTGVDAMTITGHKLGGPIGAGALLLRRELACVPLQHGGGQEREVRSGTLDVPGAVGFAAAAAVVAERRVEVAARVRELRDALVAGVLASVPDAHVNGHPERRLPGIANLTFPGCEGDALMMLLDAKGVECSTGSACSAGVAEPSHVLIAMGATPEQARSSLRFSLGHDSTRADVDAALEAIGPAVERARRAGLTSVVS
ncbi:MAG TPA: cysteine desulfurase family protein [Jatrophihabitans sp.]|nr:cysteine desulfurase family protein [Jatrophihabitans sp.]